MTKTKKTSRIALVDMDGTVADYVKALRRDLEKLRSPDEPETPENPYDQEDLPHIKLRMDLIKNQYGWWRALEPMSVGFEIVAILREFDFDLHVATKGPSSRSQAWKEKVEWCRKYLPDASVHIVEEKSLLYGKILVDDYPEYALNWLEHRPRGLVIMPAHAYNESMEGRPNILRFRGGLADVDALRQRIERLIGEMK